MYVLDEPSIGLHPRDNSRLLAALARLRDQGNTVIVVEHDEETIRAADYIVDFGPGPGVRGGEIVGRGALGDLVGSPKSLTGKFLSGAEQIEIPKRRPIGKPPENVARKPSRKTPALEKSNPVEKPSSVRRKKVAKGERGT
jgi:excinuclease ABC subunit A